MTASVSVATAAPVSAYAAARPDEDLPAVASSRERGGRGGAVPVSPAAPTMPSSSRRMGTPRRRPACRRADQVFRQYRDEQVQQGERDSAGGVAEHRAGAHGLDQLDLSAWRSCCLLLGKAEERLPRASRREAKSSRNSTRSPWASSPTAPASIPWTRSPWPPWYSTSPPARSNRHGQPLGAWAADVHAAAPSCSSSAIDPWRIRRPRWMHDHVVHGLGRLGEHVARSSTVPPAAPLAQKRAQPADPLRVEAVEGLVQHEDLGSPRSAAASPALANCRGVLPDPAAAAACSSSTSRAPRRRAAAAACEGRRRAQVAARRTARWAPDHSMCTPSVRAFGGTESTARRRSARFRRSAGSRPTMADRAVSCRRRWVPRNPVTRRAGR